MLRRIALVGIATALVTNLAALAPASAGGGGGCHRDRATSARETTIVMSRLCFTPTFATVSVGDTVTWVNKENLPHTVTAANLAWGDHKDLYIDDTVATRFTKPGTYPYYCIYHPGMAGAVLVGDANASGAGKIEDATSTLSDVDTSSAQRASTRLPATRTSRSGSGMATAAIATLACLAGFGAGRFARSPARRGA